MKNKTLIVFSSSSGNTELVCDEVARLLEEKDISVTIQRAEMSKPDDIRKYDYCILAAATYDHGVLQDHFVPLANALRKEDFTGKKFAVIGLGDSKYDPQYNVESATILEKIATDTGGEIIIPALRIDKSPILQLETNVKKWSKDLISYILHSAS